MSDGGIVEAGRVVSAGDGVVEVEISPSAACSRCGICSRGPSDLMRISVRSGPIEVGTRVRVIFPHRAHWRSIFYVFTLPLASFFAVGLTASYIAQQADLSSPVGGIAAVLAGAAGLVLGVLLARRSDKRFHAAIVERTRLEPLN